jgi:tetratricopeptide (TPR) repeat protein
MRNKFLILAILITVLSAAGAAAVTAQARKTPPAAAAQKSAALPSRTITVVTEPNAVVWIDDIKRGVADQSGKLVIKPVSAGARKIRVRADGFKETSIPLLPTQKGDVKVALTETTDEAELAFQEAERQLGRDRSKAIEYYRKAIEARPRYAEAHVALARALTAAGEHESALKEIAAARRIRPSYPEASAVEGRIYIAEGEQEKALASFRRSIAEGKGFQPEAHAGLGLLYKERADAFNAEADFENANANYDLAARELRKSLTQLAGAPDAKDLYQLLGDLYYRAKKYPEAIKTYEEFLRVFPDSNEAVTMRSLIVQTTKEMNGEQ